MKLGREIGDADKGDVEGGPFNFWESFRVDERLEKQETGNWVTLQADLVQSDSGYLGPGEGEWFSRKLAGERERERDWV